MRQRISKRVANVFPWSWTTHKVAVARWVAPFAIGVPVPGFHVEFCVLSIGDWLPSRRKHLLHRGLGKHLVGGLKVDTVDASTKRFGWNECFGGMRYIH